MPSIRSSRRRLAVPAALLAVAALALLPVASSSAAAPAAKPDKPAKPKTVDVRLISINDFHGNLEPPAGSSGRQLLDDGTTVVDAGGAAYLATHVFQAEAAVQNSFVVAAGDLIGASPLASALFHDEPTVKFMNYIGLTASAAGNHEFDEGYQELLRIQNGGCHPVDGCQFEPSYSGTNFPYLGANVTLANGRPALLPFTIKVEAGIPIGLIGAPLEGTPDIVSPDGIKDLRFGDEVAAINKTANLLQKMGVKAQVVLLHQGDNTLTGAKPNACNVAPGGLGSEIAAKVSPKVDAIFAGHSHQAYNCVINDPDGDPRPVTQASSFGRVITLLDLTINANSKDVVRSETVAHNEVVTRTVPADAGAQAIVNDAVAKSAPIGNRQVGTISSTIVRAAGLSGESPLGDAIADGQLAASADAVVALMNPGGVRADLLFPSSPDGEGDGVVTYKEAFTVQPFANIMQTITLTGAQLDAVLEQQWILQANGSELVRILQPSSSLHYTWTASAPIGSRVSDITINGTPVDPAASYRVTANNFLVAGGDSFSAFTAGTDLVGGPIDLDAFTAYLTAHPNLAPPPTDRITRLP